MNHIDTKERILDAAEHLFARDGFHRTSLRAITGEARVNLAAVHYHFGSKEALLDAIFERRLDPMNRSRRESLEALVETARRKGERPAVRDALRAFILPALSLAEGGGGDFMTLVGRTFAEPDDALRGLFMSRMQPLFLLLFETVAEALPALSRETLFGRLQFALGAMGHTMCRRGRFSILPEGISPTGDPAAQAEALIHFVAAGLEAP